MAGGGYIECVQLCNSALWPTRTPSWWSELSSIPKTRPDRWKMWRQKWWPPNECPPSKSASFDATSILSAGVLHKKQLKWCAHEGGIAWLWWYAGESFWSIVSSSEKWGWDGSASKASSLVWNEKRRVAAIGQPATNHLLHTVTFFSCVAMNHLLNTHSDLIWVSARKCYHISQL